jgi:hypothetical protein
MTLGPLVYICEFVVVMLLHSSFMFLTYPLSTEHLEYFIHEAE